MPLYEYQCHTCSKRFEQLLFGKETPSCPACHGTDLEKLLSTFAVGGEGSSTSFGGSDFDAGDPGSDAGDDSDFSGGGACGSCGDPRGPGSCAID